MEQELKSLIDNFFTVYNIPRMYIDYTCGAESEDEDCPSEDTECKDCPYKALEMKELTIEDKHMVEFISVCGNHKMLNFPYKSSLEMKKHVMQLVINSCKFPPVVKVVKKFFHTDK